MDTVPNEMVYSKTHLHKPDVPGAIILSTYTF